MQLTIGLSVSGMGLTISKQASRTEDGGGGNSPTVAKGYAGTLTTRTDNETGSLTLGNGHGITTGQVIDLYWSGGARYGITVGTVSTNVVPIGADNVGTGDNLPTAATAIIASPRTTLSAAIDGDELGAIAFVLEFADPTTVAKSRIRFLDGSAAQIAAVTLDANVPRLYDVTGGDANPFTGNPITSVVISHAGTAADATLKIVWVQDST